MKAKAEGMIAASLSNSKSENGKLNLDTNKHHYAATQKRYVCDHPDCDQSFSRIYTLSIHMKTHQYCFQNYQDYKKTPQTFLDNQMS